MSKLPSCAFNDERKAKKKFEDAERMEQERLKAERIELVLQFAEEKLA